MNLEDIPVRHDDSPDVIVGSSHHHHAVISPQFLSEFLHSFHGALQTVLTDNKQHWGLHVQQWVIYILRVTQTT